MVHIFLDRFEHRIYVTHNMLRKLLKRFILAGSTWKRKNFKILSDNEKVEMFDGLQKYYIYIYRFLKSIVPSGNTVPSFAKNFLLSITSKSPITVYVPVTSITKPLLSDIIENRDIKKSSIKCVMMQQHLPIIYNILCHENSPSISTEFRELLSELVHKSESMYQNCQAVPPQNNLVMGDMNKQLTFFPSLPVLRNRPLFVADKQRGNKEGVCGKMYKGHPTLLPGIFAIYCSHGIQVLYKRF